MAYNREASAADGTSPSPTTGTPGARPNPDVALVPCCSGHSPADQPAGASLVDSAVPVMADISDLHAVLKSKSSPPRHDSRGIRYTSTQLSDLSATAKPAETPSSTMNCNLRSPQPQPHEERILSPLTLSPRQSGGSSTQTPVRQQAANRCVACRKRLGLLGFKCRCGDLFCAPHRYSDKHDCSFDYKAAGRLAIAKENPVVKASKIDRI